MIEVVFVLHNQADVESATADSLALWAAQAVEPDHPGKPGAAWAYGGAVAVYAPELNCRDRLVVAGEPADAATLAAALLADLPPVVTIAHTDLADQLGALTGLRVAATFGWMSNRAAIRPPAAPDGYRFGWLDTPGQDAEVAALLDAANPNAWVRPGEPGTLRWYGAWHGQRLVAVAAEAWSARYTGFVGGVATASGHRGRGLSTVVCGRLAEVLRAERGMVTLMVDRDNIPAIRGYTRLGFDYRSITALRRQSVADFS